MEEKPYLPDLQTLNQQRSINRQPVKHTAENGQ